LARDLLIETTRAVRTGGAELVGNSVHTLRQRMPASDILLSFTR
jgi:hypothetical protein